MSHLQLQNSHQHQQKFYFNRCHEKIHKINALRSIILVDISSHHLLSLHPQVKILTEQDLHSYEYCILLAGYSKTRLHWIKKNLTRQVKEILTRQAKLELEKQLSYGISYYPG